MTAADIAELLRQDAEKLAAAHDYDVVRLHFEYARRTAGSFTTTLAGSKAECDRYCRAWQIAMARAPEVITTFDYPPIPDRSLDWSAVYDDYEGGDGYDERPGPMGHGRTEQEAIDDLTTNYPRE